MWTALVAVARIGLVLFSILALISMAIDAFVVPPASEGQLAAVYFWLGQIETFSFAAAILIAGVLMGGARAGVALVALGGVLVVSGFVAAAFDPDPPRLHWPGFATLGAGALSAGRFPRAALIVALGLGVGVILLLGILALKDAVLDRFCE